MINIKGRVDNLLEEVKDFENISNIVGNKRKINLTFRLGQYFTDKQQFNELMANYHLFWFMTRIYESLSKEEGELFSQGDEIIAEDGRLSPTEDYGKITAWLVESTVKVMDPLYNDDNEYYSDDKEELKRRKQELDSLPDEVYAEPSRQNSHGYKTIALFEYLMEEPTFTDESIDSGNSLSNVSNDKGNDRSLLNEEQTRTSIDYNGEQSEYFCVYMLEHNEACMGRYGNISLSTMKLFLQFVNYEHRTKTDKIILSSFCGRLWRCINMYESQVTEQSNKPITQMIAYIKIHPEALKLFIFMLDEIKKGPIQELKGILEILGSIYVDQSFKILPQDRISLRLKAPELNHIVSINLNLQPIYKVGKKRIFDLDCLLDLHTLDLGRDRRGKNN